MPAHSFVWTVNTANDSICRGKWKTGVREEFEILRKRIRKFSDPAGLHSERSWTDFFPWITISKYNDSVLKRDKFPFLSAWESVVNLLIQFSCKYLTWHAVRSVLWLHESVRKLFCTRTSKKPESRFNDDSMMASDVRLRPSYVKNEHYQKYN